MFWGGALPRTVPFGTTMHLATDARWWISSHMTINSKPQTCSLARDDAHVCDDDHDGVHGDGGDGDHDGEEEEEEGGAEKQNTKDRRIKENKC